MLVLSAVHITKYMTSPVPEEKFRQLLHRTITFLRRLAPISPMCAADCSILEELNATLFGVEEDITSVYRSEGIETGSNVDENSLNPGQVVDRDRRSSRTPV